LGGERGKRFSSGGATGVSSKGERKSQPYPSQVRERKIPKKKKP